MEIEVEGRKVDAEFIIGYRLNNWFCHGLFKVEGKTDTVGISDSKEKMCEWRYAKQDRSEMSVEEFISILKKIAKEGNMDFPEPTTEDDFLCKFRIFDAITGRTIYMSKEKFIETMI